MKDLQDLHCTQFAKSRRSTEAGCWQAFLLLCILLVRHPHVLRSGSNPHLSPYTLQGYLAH